MNDRTPGSPRRRGPVARLLDLIDDRVSRRTDRDAMERGLQVTRLNDRARTHVYRSPVWDRRQLCATCSGSGMDGARSCTACDGSGVVTLGAPTEAGER